MHKCLIVIDYTQAENEIRVALDKAKLSKHWNVFESNNILKWDDVDATFYALIEDEKLRKFVETTLKKMEQSKFESAVKGLRENKKQSTNFEFAAIYGKDLQKANSDLGKRKVLPRLCSKHVNGQELRDYIGADMQFGYCVLIEGKNCCEEMKQYEFDEMKYSLNLSEQIIKSLHNGALKPIFEDGMCEYLVTDKNADCIIDVNGFQLYLKTITQDALSSGMEPRQVQLYVHLF